MVQCPMIMPRYLQSFSSSWEPHSLGALILIVEAKQWWHRQDWVRTYRSSGANALFSDGLGYQLPAFPQMYCIGVELGLLANPINASCKISPSLKIAFFRRGWPDQCLSPPLCEAWFPISEHVLHHKCLSGMWGWCCSSIFGWDNLNFQTILSLRAVQHLLPCQGLRLWMRVGATKCLHLLSSFWPLGGVRVWPSVWTLTSRLLTIQVTWSGGYWHRNSNHKLKLQISSFSSGARAHARKLRNDWACASHV